MKKIIIGCLLFLGFALSYEWAIAGERCQNCPSDQANDAAFLKEAANDILSHIENPSEIGPSSKKGAVGGRAGSKPAMKNIIVPPGASHKQPPSEAIPVITPPIRKKRSMEKQTPECKGDCSSTSTLRRELLDWRQVSFSSGSFIPPYGVHSRMASEVASLKARGRSFVYGFILMDEYLSDETEKELNRMGVKILGPHSEVYKARFPADTGVLEKVVGLSYIEWVGYSEPRQKLCIDLQKIMSGEGGLEQLEGIPIVINLFDDDWDGGFKQGLEAAGAIVGEYDSELRSYRAVASRAAINRMILLDFVLFIEPVRRTSVGHDQSMATMGVDYIRTGGWETPFDGSTIPLGIMDTGFDMNHDDLNKWYCGQNYTPETRWEDDQNGHGSHVLGIICGTGTAQARYRGVAPGIGEARADAIRVAKVLGRLGTGSSLWMENAMDWFDDESDCGGDSARPMVVNMSCGVGSGITGSNYIGTDSLSRKLDEKVWTYGQLYVVAAGNQGPNSGTVQQPAVAKNALAVGNVQDFGYLTVGDLATAIPSSRGPTGDNRMKPNLVATGEWVTSVDAGTTNLYTDMSGTSMATPHITGIAATLMQHYPDFQWKPYFLRAHLMAATLFHDDQTSPNDNSSGGRNDYGLGRVDAYLAHWDRDNANGWSEGWTSGWVDPQTYVYIDVNVPTGANRLVVVMTWDEPAASAGASQAVLYDLDLWVDIGADCVDPKGECGEYTSQSNIDNVEYLIFDFPSPGTYRIKAVPWNVPSSGLPVGIAAYVIRGNPTPSISLTATPSTTTPLVGSIFTVTTTVSNPSYVASGVHLTRTAFSSGLTNLDVETTRVDDVVMNFGTVDNLTLGNIVESDNRSATWYFHADSAGNKTISFRAWSENGGTVTKDVTIVVTPPQVFFVTPADGLISSGNQGGPFSPSSKGYTLQNTGGSSINWTASKGQAWTTLSSTSGTLAAGGNTTVTVSVNNNANSLAPGSYSDTVSFTNTTNGNGNTTRSVSLTVNTLLPSVSITLLPDTTTVSRGGTLGYTVTCNNNTSSSQTFQYWTYVTLPNGARYPQSRELMGPIPVTLSGAEQKSVHLTHPISGSAPLGTYTYNASVGSYPPVLDSDSFQFTVN